MKKEYAFFEEMTVKARRILIISHRKPDGDTLGAACALKLALEQRGDKEIGLACVDEVGERFKFIPEVDKFQKTIGNYAEWDLLIAVDCGAHYMMKYNETNPEVLSGQVPMINIDHHASNDMFGQLNIVEDYEPSATAILYKIFKQLDYKITPDIATCLMAGIYNDTGSFMHSNTSTDILKVSADLVAKGAKITIIAKSIFKTNPVATLKAWGKAMNNAVMTDEGFTLSVVTADEIAECGASVDDLSGVVDVLNSVPDSRFTAMIVEDGRGNVKGSFRTNVEEVDLLPIVEQFGGGGHRKAAGFTVKGKLKKKEIWTLDADGSTKDLSQMEVGS